MDHFSKEMNQLFPSPVYQLNSSNIVQRRPEKEQLDNSIDNPFNATVHQFEIMDINTVYGTVDLI